MLAYTIDHVVFAHPELADAVQTFTALGFAPVAGGRHGSGATENALIPFADGSYIELLARIPGGGASPLWEEPLEEGAGWCDWCLGVPDMAQAESHLRSAGLQLRGPFAMHRDRPGSLPRAAWDLAFVRQESAGGALPFVISDTSLREYRVPRASEGSRFGGIAQVIVAVPSDEEWRPRLARYFGLPETLSVPRADLADTVFQGCTLTELWHTPVIVAEPTQDGPLGERVRRFGSMLCGVLLKSDKTEWLATDIERGLVIGTVADE